MTKLELLSPAKNLECGIAAVNCGADAVYIGAPKFGARSAAGNSIKDIEQLINYAHKFWAKVYITINTIIYDNELNDVSSLIKKLYDIGADAVIIQDMGILEMDLPPIPVIASTQTHNYSIDKIKFLENIGIRRVILARELSLEKIKKIRSNTELELEFFVHGALCVCFSGQCYFSYTSTGRSANRGECSQPCRMLYTLEDSSGREIIKDKYLLSLKDLNLSSHLKELIDAGITSFKIEGRLKDIDYVKNVTAFYRQKLDAIIDGSDDLFRTSSGKVYFDFIPDIEKTFNRGYTDYFVKTDNKNLSSFDTPKSIGKYIGKVSRITGEYFEIDTKEKLANGDGICFLDKKNNLQGMNISKAEGRKIYFKDNTELHVGQKIYRNYDHNFTKELLTDKTVRKVNAIISISETDKGLIVKAADEDKNRIETEFVIEKKPAENPQKILAAFEKQFKKTGDTIFEVSEVRLAFEQPVFLPSSAINEMRRTALEKLLNERLKNFRRDIIYIHENNVPFPAGRLNYKGNVVNELARKFYSRHGVGNIEEGFEKMNDHSGSIIMTTKYCIKNELNICPHKSDSVPAEFKEPLYLRDKTRRYKLIFNCRECEMNIELE